MPKKKINFIKNYFNRKVKAVDQSVQISKQQENTQQHEKELNKKHLKRIEILLSKIEYYRNQISKLTERNQTLVEQKKTQFSKIKKLQENTQQQKKELNEKHLKRIEALLSQIEYYRNQISKLIKGRNILLKHNEVFKKKIRHYTAKAKADLKPFATSVTPSLRVTKFFDSMFNFAQFTSRYIDNLQSDSYIFIGKLDLLAIATLKARFGGKIIWYVNEHPLSDLQRYFSSKLYNKVDRQFINYLDTIHQEMLSVIDLCICTGQGYADILSRTGVQAYNINRYIDVDINVIDNLDDNIIRDKLFLDPTKQIILAYPCTIYPTSDFISILKYMLSLPKNYILLHIGRFASKELQSESEYYRDIMGLKDRVKFCGHYEKSEMLQILKGCHLGIVHQAASVESNRLSLHNRYADLIAAGLPFIATENESLSFLLENKLAVIIYDWTCLESMKNATLTMINQLDQSRIAIRDLRKYFDIQMYDSIFKTIFSKIKTISLISQVDWRKVVELPPFLTYLLENNLKIKVLSPEDKSVSSTNLINNIMSHPNITFISHNS
ncbi:hypothetical protein ACNVED_12060 [Legionella sp. D16C41]|uniref:hypothetical protein n=1 Tax=Legionella sp. D16C41 TaxID=3402688 RepID=UPI003AF9719E